MTQIKPTPNHPTLYTDMIGTLLATYPDGMILAQFPVENVCDGRFFLFPHEFEVISDA
jgi:hypothetical protein